MTSTVSKTFLKFPIASLSGRPW